MLRDFVKCTTTFFKKNNFSPNYVFLCKRNRNKNMKKELSEGINESSHIEYTTAADFEICDTALEFIKRLRNLLGNDCCNFMEESYNGLSHKMQFVMTIEFIII